MKIYNVYKTSDLSNFKDDAASQLRNFILENGDIANYIDARSTPSEYLNTYKYWKSSYDEINQVYENVWMVLIDDFDSIKLESGNARTFRLDTLNSNYKTAEDLTNRVADNITEIYNNLSSVSMSSLAEDLRQTEDNQFVTTDDKILWNKKLWLGTIDGNTSIFQWDNNNSQPVDITENIKTLFDIQNRTKTSQLNNNLKYLTYGNYESTNTIAVSNYRVMKLEENSEQEGFYYKGEIILPGCESDMMANIVFNNEDCLSGYYSRICETDTNKIYFWSREEILPVIPLVIAYRSDTITSMDFTITDGNNVYDLIFDNGMNWEDWVASEYNTIGATISGTKIVVNNRYIYLGNNEATKESHIRPIDYIVSLNYLQFTANTDGSSIKFPKTFQYTRDRITWETAGISNWIMLINAGDSIWVRNGDVGSINSKIGTIEMSGSISAHGNIMSLIDNYCESTTIPRQNCFNELFKNCTSLTSAPTLPATTLAISCYEGMFHNCTSLEIAPELPATTLADYCYNSMFRNCTSLETSPALPATTLATSCYRYMFYECTSLTSAPTLPATTLASDCYSGMFYWCTALTKAPELPAITLANSCYWCMFYSCTSLTTPPSTLPATTLANHCYEYMFGWCASLTSAPALPATTLASDCYGGMFYGCESLIIPPVLQATTLANSCYESMFHGCYSLETPPVLPATVLVDGCYRHMFELCTSLTTPPALPATTLADECYYGMFNNCISLITPPALPAATLANDCYVGMFTGCTSLIVSDASGTGYDKTWTIPTSGTFTNTYSQSNMFDNCATGSGRASDDMPGESGKSYTYYTQNIPVSIPLCFSANTANSTIGMSITGTPTLGQNFQTSTDMITWTEFIPGTTTITLTNVGDRVYFKGNNPNGVNQYNNKYYKFIMSGSISSFGNIMSIIDNWTCNTLTIPNSHCFYGIFSDCAALTTCPELPAITLHTNCYKHMFRNCISLIHSPSLPSTTLSFGCYYEMFIGCTELIQAPLLPAIELNDNCGNCYYGMFKNCTSLTIPPELPATILSGSCYADMFSGCSSLLSTPLLPAMRATSYCYASMFEGCVSLTTVPVLPATILGIGSYRSMFKNCTSITTVPILPTIHLQEHCYQYMFEGCTSLSINTSGTYEWRIPISGSGYKTDFSLHNMLTNTAGNVTGTPSINTTYYCNNKPVGLPDYLCFASNTAGSTVTGAEGGSVVLSDSISFTNPTGPITVMITAVQGYRFEFDFDITSKIISAGAGAFSANILLAMNGSTYSGVSFGVSGSRVTIYYGGVLFYDSDSSGWTNPNGMYIIITGGSSKDSLATYIRNAGIAIEIT